MKTHEFEVPLETMLMFVGTLEENDMTGNVIGVNGDDEIIIEVSYEKEDRSVIHELSDIIEDYYEKEDEEDEEDEEYDEDEDEDEDERYDDGI